MATSRWTTGGRSTPARSGDVLAGLAAQSAVERMAARIQQPHAGIETHIGRTRYQRIVGEPRVAGGVIDHERLGTFTLTADARAIGQSIGALALEAVGVHVANVRRQDGKAVKHDPQTVLVHGDTLVLSGKPEALALAIARLQRG